MKQKIILFVLIGFAFVFVTLKFASHYRHSGYKAIVDSNTDSEGYYEYLPCTINNHDPINQPYAIIMEDGKHFNKYTYGVAFMEAPFFLIANTLAPTFGYATEGYNDFYGYAILVSTTIYVYIGFYVLFFLLYKRYSRFVSFLSILCFYFGTGLFYYTIMEPGMSHAYSFFCFSMVMFFIDKYYEECKFKYIFPLGFFLALATLIRPTNILLLAIFIFYETYSIAEIKNKIKFHFKHYYNFIVLFIIGLVLFLPQMLYWHAVTGKYIFYSYLNETFSNWKSPKIIEVLIGHKSGWLLFSPILVLSIIGLLMGWKKKMVNAPVITFVFIVILYLCASWWAFTFGAAYGYRSFIEYQALLIFPFALFLNQAFKSKYKAIKLLTISFCVFCMWYSVKLTGLYFLTGGCWDGPYWTWANQLHMMKEALIY